MNLCQMHETIIIEINKIKIKIKHTNGLIQVLDSENGVVSS